MAKGRREFTHDVVQHFLTDSADPQLLFGQRFFRCGRLLGGGMNLMDGHTSIVWDHADVVLALEQLPLDWRGLLMPFRLVNLVDAYILSIFIIFKQVSCLQRETFGNELAAKGDSVVNNNKKWSTYYSIFVLWVPTGLTSFWKRFAEGRWKLTTSHHTFCIIGPDCPVFN